MISLITSEADCKGEVAGVAATIVGRPAQEGPFVLADALLLHLLLTQLDLPRQALHRLDVREPLPAKLSSCALHLLDAWRKTANPPQSLEGALGVHQSCPGIGHVEKESVRADLDALHCKAVIDHIAPGGSHVGEAEIEEKLLGDLCALLVELEGEEVAVLDGLRKGTGERAGTGAGLHHHAARHDVELEQDGRVVHGVEDLRLAGQGLGDERGLGLESALELAGPVKGLDLGGPGLVDEVEVPEGSPVSSLDLVARDELLQLGAVFLLEQDRVRVVLHPLLRYFSLHIIYQHGRGRWEERDGRGQQNQAAGIYPSRSGVAYEQMHQKAFLLSSIKITLMLSHPNCSVFGFFPRKPSSISSRTVSGVLPLSLSTRIRSISPCPSFSQRSQTPSQPMMMKSSSRQSSMLLMSGWPVMVWRWYWRSLFFLQWWSPRQRERFRWLLMRPFSTFEPEETMRSSSSGFYGLWSQESSMMEPARLSAARESPALATYSFFPTSKATLAVHPTESATLLFWLSKGCMPFSIVMFCSVFSPASVIISRSSSKKVSSRARSQSPRWKASFCSITSGRCLAQNLETSRPPWPSKTANRKTSLLMRWKTTASSMCLRHPESPHAYLASRR